MSNLFVAETLVKRNTLTLLGMCVMENAFTEKECECKMTLCAMLLNPSGYIRTIIALHVGCFDTYMHLLIWRK